MACGGNVWNTLKGGVTEKRGAETKIFKGGGGQAGSRGAYLKRGDAGNPLETMTPERLSHPTFDCHLFGGTLSIHKGSARIKLHWATFNIYAILVKYIDIHGLPYNMVGYVALRGKS